MISLSIILSVAILILVLVLAHKPELNAALIIPIGLLLFAIPTLTTCNCGRCNECKDRSVEKFAGSPYGNISLDEDIDTMQQRIIDPDMPAKEGDNAPTIDNTDTIMSVLNTGANINLPPGQGITTSNSGIMTSLTLAMPGGSDAAYPGFDTGDGANMNADEQIARKSQHRGQINRKALDGIVRNTRRTFDRMYTKELEYNENRVWWETDNADSTPNDFWPYDINL